MSSIDIFPWNDNFTCGIEAVDEQHRVLVRLLNDLASYVAFGSDLPTLNRIVDELADYAAYHFQTEEIIWHRFLQGDSLEINHLAAHDGFNKKIAATRLRIGVSQDHTVVEELLFFLTRWLAAHILENDRYMAAVTRKLGEGIPLEPAKHLAMEELGGSTRVLVDLILAIYESLTLNALGLMREIKRGQRQEELIRNHAFELEGAFLRAVQLATIMNEMRDPYTVGHEKRVSKIAVAIGRLMNLEADRLLGIEVGGLLHDIGKISVPAEILSKPGKITTIEFELIKTHSRTGFSILEDVRFPWPVEQVALQHHERLDGSGYPQGLKGDEILLEARIVAVADVVESMASHRPYRPSLGIDAAMHHIEAEAGRLFDPAVATACLALFREQHFDYHAL